MKLLIDKDVVTWYKKELHLVPGDSIKLYGKVYGTMGGFSMGIEKVAPTRPFIEETIDGITFYIEKNDAWFFENGDIKVTMDPKLKEPVYSLERA